MAGEYRQLILVSADQIDSAVSWVEANKVNIIQKLETLDAEVLQLSEDVLLIKGLDLQYMQNDVNDLKSSLSTLNAEVMQLTEDVLLIKGLDLQHMKADIEDLQANTYTKTETDAKITEKVSALVAGAPERFDTLKELANWIDSHADSAAAMNSAIEKNAADITTANTNISKNAEDIAIANTNIQKNVDDIAAVKNSIAVNKSTLGTQCKNLLNPDTHIVSRCTEEKDDNTYTVTNAGTWSQWYWFLKGKTGQKYILTFEISELTGDSTLNDVYIKDISTDVSIKNFSVRTNGTLSIEFTAVSNGEIRIGWCPNNSGTNRELSFKVSNFMCRSADITDSTYEPYTPSIQEQIEKINSNVVYQSVYQSATLKSCNEAITTGNYRVYSSSTDKPTDLRFGDMRVVGASDFINQTIFYVSSDNISKIALRFSIDNGATFSDWTIFTSAAIATTTEGGE